MIRNIKPIPKGTVKNWSGRTLKKINLGQWEETTILKTGTQKKQLLSFNVVKKIIEEEYLKKLNERQILKDEFVKNWRKEKNSKARYEVVESFYFDFEKTNPKAKKKK